MNLANDPAIPEEGAARCCACDPVDGVYEEAGSVELTAEDEWVMSSSSAGGNCGPPEDTAACMSVVVGIRGGDLGMEATLVICAGEEGGGVLTVRSGEAE